MTAVQESVVKRAIRVRMSGGEDFYDILDSYPRITPEDKQMLTDYFIGEGLVVPK